MVLGLHLASQPRRKCWGQADPRKGALSMLKGELQAWSWVPRGPRPQHSWEMGVARMLGRLGGFDTVTGQLSMEPPHKDRHADNTAARSSLDTPCLHKLTFCRHHWPSSAGPRNLSLEVLPSPVPGPQRLAPALLAILLQPWSQTGWAPRPLHQVAPQGLLL